MLDGSHHRIQTCSCVAFRPECMIQNDQNQTEPIWKVGGVPQFGMSCGGFQEPLMTYTSLILSRGGCCVETQCQGTFPTPSIGLRFYFCWYLGSRHITIPPKRYILLSQGSLNSLGWVMNMGYHQCPGDWLRSVLKSQTELFKESA